MQFALFLSCSPTHDRKAWLFAGSELAGQRAAVVMSLVQSAKLNGHDPWAYLKDVLTRLPMHLNRAGSRNCCRIAGSRTTVLVD